MNDNNKSIVRAVFSEKESESLKFLMEVFNMSKPHDLLRFLVARTFQDEKNNQLRYGRSTRLQDKDIMKMQSEARENALLAMSNEELTDELIKIGYSPANAGMEGNENLIVTYQVDDFQGARWYMQYIYDKSQGGKITSSATLLNMGELISDLKKKKLL